jgi:hydroxymethylglutaryl-CoA lyase
LFGALRISVRKRLNFAVSGLASIFIRLVLWLSFVRLSFQNEPGVVETATKVALIEALGHAGLDYIEAASFVSPKWVPQMGDNKDVFAAINRPSDGVRKPGVVYSALTPNMRGLESALEAGVDEVAVFGAASDAFSLKNINCTVMESLERFEPVCEAAAKAGIPVRGYVSTVMGCPYAGDVDPGAVGWVARKLLDMGCREVSLGDTIGVGTPLQMQRVVHAVTSEHEHGVPLSAVAVHCHDTYGTALANILAAMQMGVSVIDAAVAGLGGCPYAKGASGNVATEDVVYMCQGMGVETGVHMEPLLAASSLSSEALGRKPNSKAALALLAKLEDQRAAAEARTDTKAIRDEQRNQAAPDAAMPVGVASRVCSEPATMRQ